MPPSNAGGDAAETVMRRVMFVVTLIRFMDARVANGYATQIVGVSCVLWSRVVNASAAIS